MKRVGNSGLEVSCKLASPWPCFYGDATVELTTCVFFCRITAQLVGPRTKEPFTEGPRLQDLDLVNGPNRVQFASFNFNDLEAIAPWLELTKKIEGPGLGN